MNRILSFATSLGREITGLHEAAYLLAASAVASLFFALVRDRLLAHVLGASSTLDIYYAAFRVPDFIFITVASLVSTSILVPYLVESREAGGRDELKKSIDSLFSAFFVIILVVCGIVYFFMPQLQAWLFPHMFALGLGDELISTSRILLLSPIILGFSSFFASLTQIGNRFLIYAVSSPLYNVGIIIGILFFLPSLGVKGLALGVILGALMLVASQVPFVVWEGLFPRLKLLSFEWFRVRRVAIHVIPRTITMSSQQITSLTLVSFASMLGAGSISIFNLAFNLQSVPLSIIGASYSSAAFPVLAKLVAENNKEAFLGKVISAVRHILFWSIPLSILFIVLRAQIVRTVLGSGLFSWSDTKLTAAALALFIISSVGQCLMLLFVRTFYAEGKTAKPLLMNITCTLVTIGLGYGLIKLYFAWPLFADFIQALLKTEGAADSSVLMLPLAFSIGTLLNLIMHWRSFSHEFPAFNKPVFKTAFHSLAASIVGGYVAYFSLRFFDDVFNVETSLGVFLQGLCAGMIGSVVIVLILYLFKSSELRDIAKTLKEKVWRVDESSLDQVPQ